MDPINLADYRSPEVKFDFVSQKMDIVRASVGADGKKMLHGVASSTTKDLHGDQILLSALEDMERTAVGMTIFRNHSYNVPDDVAGTVTKALIKQQGVDHNGDPNYSLIFDIEVEEDNPQAVQTWKYVQKGRKLGLSIGAMIPEGGAKRQKDGSYIIEHVLLLETSLVGIPANPKSWVEYAASALRGLEKKATTTNLGNPTLTLEGDVYRIEGSLAGLDINLAAGEPKVGETTVTWSFTTEVDKVRIDRIIVVDGADPRVETIGAWDLSDPDERLVAIATAGEEAVTKATVWVETRDGDKITIGEPVEDSVDASTTKDACPDCGQEFCPDDSKCNTPRRRPRGERRDAEPETGAAADPDVTDAKIRIIEVDTDDPSSGDGQGASSEGEPDDADTLSAPEADVTAETEPVILEGEAGDELLKLSFGQLQAAALATLNELIETKRLLAEEKQARVAAEHQREAVIEAAGELVRRTSEVIEKVANSPLSRKAVVTEVREQYAASIAGYYGEEFARAIAGTKS